MDVGQEHQPAVGAGRQVVRVRVRPDRDQQPLPLRARRTTSTSSPTCFTGAQSITPAVARPELGAGSRPARVRVLREPEQRRLHHPEPAVAQARPWRPAPPAPVAARTDPARAAAGDARPARRFGAVAAARPTPRPAAPGAGRPRRREGGSIYRTPSGFRAAAQAPGVADTAGARRAADVTVIGLLDSASLFLPDTSSFTIGPYKRRFTPDNVARPSVGYTRDNFGNGIYGGGAIQFGDMLGNEQLIFAGYINGSHQPGRLPGGLRQPRAADSTGPSGSSRSRTYYVLQPIDSRTTRQPGLNTYVHPHPAPLPAREIFGRGFYNSTGSSGSSLALTLGQIDEGIQSFVEVYDRTTGPSVGDPQKTTTYFDGQQCRDALDRAGVRRHVHGLDRPPLRHPVPVRGGPDGGRLERTPSSWRTTGGTSRSRARSSWRPAPSISARRDRTRTGSGTSSAAPTWCAARRRAPTTGTNAPRRAATSPPSAGVTRSTR